jgi:hypothetical protein
MIVRMAMLVILTGTLPLSAAASSTATGRVWFRRSVGWLLAFVLYKPAAAIVYAAAFSMTGPTQDSQANQDNDVVSMISGVVLIVLACFTLPALMRFAAPVVQAAASGKGRGAGASAGSGGAVAAIGALPVPQLRGPAAGRSVSGAAVHPEGHGTTGARGTPIAKAGGQAPARGVGEALGPSDGERTAGDTARPPQPAGPEDTGETEPEHSWEEAAPALLSARQHTRDQQEEPRGSH